MWTELGHAQLDNGAVGDAIASYLRRCASAISRWMECACACDGRDGVLSLCHGEAMPYA